MFAQHRRAMVLAAMFATAISAALGGGPSADAYVDTEYGVKVTPPADWKSMPLGDYKVPGRLRAAWSPGDETSLTVFVQQAGQRVTAKELTESNVAMCKKAGWDIKSERVGKVAGLDAMSLVIVADGTGSAISAGGAVRTAQHSVAIPRGEEILVFLLTTPEEKLDKHEATFKTLVRTLEVSKDKPAAAATADAPAFAKIQSCDFESDSAGQMPTGWVRWGQKDSPYQVVTDGATGHSGKQSCRIEYVGTGPADGDSFGGCGKGVQAEAWLGKRVRLSGYVRTEKVVGDGACLCLRVDGPDKSLAFDNMAANDRAIHGTTGWKKYALVLDVAQEAKFIAFGFFLDGSGKMWVDDLQLEVVGSDVPVTAPSR